ncbi:MAG: rhomboid family intramembrane serine protease [Candidatus Melainabacteria bacterium]|nr:rhomboid family intramembrane serine protease [Candidatus Melainabacteria bacterium]
MLIVGDDNETRSLPFVNISVIAACTLIAVWTFSNAVDAESVIKNYGSVPVRFFTHQNMAEYFTIISSTFLHGSYLHLIGNMWYLYIFGDNIEDHFGHFNYFCFYMTCGIVSGLAQMGAEPTSWIPSVGASGAIAGVLGAYLVLYPHAKVKTWWGDDSLIFAFRSYMMPAWIIIGGWFVLQYICMNAKIPGIGWHAHIFGFLTGMAVVFIYRMCGEKCADNDSHAHYGYAHVPAGSAHLQNTSAAMTKVVVVLLLTGALTVCGAYYLNHRDTSQSPAVASQPKKVRTTAAQTSKKTRPIQKTRHSKTIDRRHANHKRSAAIS